MEKLENLLFTAKVQKPGVPGLTFMEKMVQNKINSLLGFYWPDHHIFRRVLARLKEDGLSEPQILKIKNSAHPDYAKLLTVVANNTTNFFRNFHLPTDLNPILEDLNKNKEYQILSLPCSIGAEPYSLAMYADKLGLKARVRGIDINPENIHKAQNAEYPWSKYESFPVGKRPAYFNEILEQNIEKSDKVFRISQKIREKVNFDCANVLDWESSPIYDFILCHNLSIYLTQNNVRILIEKLVQALNSQGVLSTDIPFTLMLEQPEIQKMPLKGFYQKKKNSA